MYGIDAQLSAPQRAEKVVRKLQIGVPLSRRVKSIEDGLAAAILESLSTITQLNMDINHVTSGVNAAPPPSSSPPPSAMLKPELGRFTSEFKKTFHTNALWTCSSDGRTVTIKEDDGYTLSVLDKPFPSTGRHKATITFTQVTSSQNYALGLVTSFASACKHNRGSKGFIGNGPSGWCLFKDGDCAHKGSWKGGGYDMFQLTANTPVSVIFDANSKTVSFEVNGKIKSDVYKNLPNEVYLAVSIDKAGSFKLNSLSWDKLTGSAPQPVRPPTTVTSAPVPPSAPGEQANMASFNKLWARLNPTGTGVLDDDELKFLIAFNFANNDKPQKDPRTSVSADEVKDFTRTVGRSKADLWNFMAPGRPGFKDAKNLELLHQEYIKWYADLDGGIRRLAVSATRKDDDDFDVVGDRFPSVTGTRETILVLISIVRAACFPVRSVHQRPLVLLVLFNLLCIRTAISCVHTL